MEMIEGEPPKAVLFDLDGTIYELEPVRRRMGRALALHALLSPLKGPRTIKALRAFRAAREELRALGDSSPSLEDAQYAEPAQQLGVDPAVVRAAVTDWMLERPLPHLFSAGRTALRPILAALKGWDLPIGVFSDYPADAKLAALGVDDLLRPMVRALVRRAGSTEGEAIPVAHSLRELAEASGLDLNDAHRALHQLLDRKLVRLVDDVLVTSDLEGLSASIDVPA